MSSGAREVEASPGGGGGSARGRARDAGGRSPEEVEVGLRRAGEDGDADHLEPDPLNPVISVIVNVSPVDVDESNGATEPWPGTHKIPGPTRVPDHAAERRRMVSPPVRMVTSKGDAVLRDPLLWHRGMPNPGSEIRHMVAMVHSKRFYERHTTIRVPQAALHSFDDHVLTTRVERVPDDDEYLAESLHL